jgi:hypothetical protein
MRKAKSSSAEIQQLRSALLRDGIMTYPLAMQAIAEFRHEVFSILERVAKPRKEAITQIVGNATFQRYSNEVDEFLDGPDTFLSFSTKGPCYFQIFVEWRDVERHPGPVHIAAGVYFEKRAMFDKVDRSLKDRFGSKFTTDDDEWGCYLEKPIQVEHVGHLELELTNTTDRWIKMLREVDVRKLIRSKQ